MADTQWPRYQVFLQDKPGSPHQDVGSIHAPDPEIALLNARDVFVRRQPCASLWVVPAQAIYISNVPELDQADSAGEPETYFVFGRTKQGGAQAYLGTIQAGSPSQALKAASQQISTQNQVTSWWVIPARLVLSSQPADIESFFEPARDKTFRRSTDFHTVSAMREIRSGRGLAGE
ncbi:MAG TPA: hypothetical protein VF823_02030 [Anaerolineales bacterium]